MARFDKDELVAACLNAVRSDPDPRISVKEIVERTVSDPGSIESEVRPWMESPMMTVWYRSEELTVLHIVWPPDVDLFAHDHNMWANIGIYGGREDNTFYRRLSDGRIEPNTEKTMLVKDVVSLGRDVVHSVANPTRDWTAAIHIYGGEFFTTPRTMWSKDTFEPMRLDTDVLRERLEAAAAAARVADTPGEAP